MRGSWSAEPADDLKLRHNRDSSLSQKKTTTKLQLLLHTDYSETISSVFGLGSQLTIPINSEVGARNCQCTVSYSTNTKMRRNRWASSIVHDPMSDSSSNIRQLDEQRGLQKECSFVCPSESGVWSSQVGVERRTDGRWLAGRWWLPCWVWPAGLFWLTPCLLWTRSGLAHQRLVALSAGPISLSSTSILILLTS